MSKVLEIATNVSTPLMVAGFLAGAFFLILMQVPENLAGGFQILCPLVALGD